MRDDENERVVQDLAEDAVRSVLLSALLTHWRSLRGANRIPPRSSFEPMRIPKLLPSILFLGADAGGGRYRIRVAGTRLGFWLGRDLTGQYLDEAAMPDSMRGHLVAHVAHESPFVVRGKSPIADGIVTDYELLGLPLADESGRCSFFLGGIDLEPSGSGVGRT